MWTNPAAAATLVAVCGQTCAQTADCHESLQEEESTQKSDCALTDWREHHVLEGSTSHRISCSADMRDTEQELWNK